LKSAVPVALRAEVEDLYARYVEILDEGPLADWPSLFSADASYRVVTRENVDRDLPLALILCESRAAIEDRVYAIEKTTFALPRRTRHLVSGLRIDGSGAPDTCDVEANFAVFETVEERLTICHSTGRYRDRLVRGGEGVLHFASKCCICDSPLVPNSLIVPL